jgi:multidrug efflux system outer membrane protein
LLSGLPAGLPSDLLFRRPDIMAAEHDLIAANANIGAARAAFFPSVSLTGSGGFVGSKLSSLFNRSNLTWSFEPQINLPIFTGGQNQANLDLAKVQKNTQIAQYEKTIQTAFREVSDALIARATYIDQEKAQRQLVVATADSLRLSTQRFRAGADNYLPVLQAQEALYSAQLTLVSLNQERLANLVTLYKALGGGWNEHTVPYEQAVPPASASQPSVPLGDLWAPPS